MGDDQGGAADSELTFRHSRRIFGHEAPPRFRPSPLTHPERAPLPGADQGPIDGPFRTTGPPMRARTSEKALEFLRAPGEFTGKHAEVAQW
ncbi:hypothetical protein Pta02_14060 [Planobispora takensis]|uniref:Uncharacterized protein n=1 Tax=Planobispora takensis TaxID=1367882 RepID=A0A8J3SSF3_9ACTN|nr:hypothetical protein Pta02_14060 [Planobispora takensis]